MWSAANFRACVLPPPGLCAVCHASVELAWDEASSVRAMTLSGAANLLHVPVRCCECNVLTWHHTCTEEGTSEAHDVCEQRRLPTQGQKRSKRIPLTRPFIGDFSSLEYVFGGAACFAVELALLQEHERYLYRGAISFEAFVQAINDKHKR